jgi:3-phosphoshikimate 1-carboxyvinyltransferase
MSSFVVDPATRPLSGQIDVPGDKSLGHRALLFSLLARQTIRIRGLGGGADNGRTARAITQLGATVSRDGDAVVVQGTGIRGMTAPAAAIDCGNSGTTIRMLCGLLAGAPFKSELFGDESLSKRPMRRVIDPLRAMGALITGAGSSQGGSSSDGGASADVVPPLAIGPLAERLHGADHKLSIASAQVKTALVLAGLQAQGVTRISEPGPSRDHTERLLAAMGAPITARGREVTVYPDDWARAGSGLELPGGTIVVPGDPSSSAFLVAAALVAGAEIVVCRGVCVNPTRTGFLDVLAKMGAHIAVENTRDVGGEPVADLVIRGAAPSLRAVEIDGDLVVRAIDEVPILAAVAARAKGVTVVRDAEELRVKESDRIATTVAMLRAFGVEAEARPDGLVVQGAPDRALNPGRVDSASDHRIAMAGSVLALAASGPSRIDDVGNVATSFPSFVSVLSSLGVTLREEA